MSLTPQPIAPIPGRTAAIAHQAFPKGTTMMAFRDELNSPYEDKDFKALFGCQGQPGWSPWRLAMITVMQYMEGLTDRQAAEAVRARLDWKYALSLELEDPGIDASVLSEFRQRLVSAGAEQQLLAQLLAHCQKRGWLKAGGSQRTDSTHVEAAMRTLHRLELLGETLRSALNSVAVVVPDWLRLLVSPDWFDRYSRRVEDYRLPKSKGERHQMALSIGSDGHQLLKAIDTEQQLREMLVQIPAVEVLRQVWIQQFYLDVEHQLHLREVDTYGSPPARELICSPYEVEARFSRKRQTQWTGYKVHLSEICDPQAPHLITHVETTSATTADSTMTQSIHQALSDKGLTPNEHLVDTGYIDAPLLIESQQQYNIKLLGPVLPDSSWQAQVPDGFDSTHFEIDWQQQQARCPQGMLSNSWEGSTDRRGQQTVKIHFPYHSCQACPQKAQCTRAQKAGRTLTLRPQAQHLALQQARDEQQSDEFKQRYAARAGIEGTLSQGISAFGLRWCRYKGLAKTRLQHIATVTAMNVVRLINWLHQQPFAQTRTSHFARLANAE
jgi:transposase